MNATTERVGNKVIRTTRTEFDAVIDWQSILDACVVEPDETMSDAPWDWSGSLEHTARYANQTHGIYTCLDAKGYFYDRGGRPRIVRMKPDLKLFEWYRDHGCSRQVAAEMVAKQDRVDVSRIVNWRANGWQWWQVHCEINGVSDSLGGINSESYARGECCADVARVVASDLDRAGYTITGLPDPEPCERRSRLWMDCWTN